jgi:nicotinamide riboside transporter PnuC
MSKKKNKKNNKNEAAQKSSKSASWIIVAVIAGFAVLAVSVSVLKGGNDSSGVKGRSFSVNGGETRPVLDPLMFTGQVRAAYAAAQKYPEVLNQVFCYCFCDAEPFNHKSLLSCFTGRHGAG